MLLVLQPCVSLITQRLQLAVQWSWSLAHSKHGEVHALVAVKVDQSTISQEHLR
jgi:hypothetical protein